MRFRRGRRRFGRGRRRVFRGRMRRAFRGRRLRIGSRM